MYWSFTFLLHNQVSDTLGLGQVSKYTHGFQNGVHTGTEHQLQHHWMTERGGGVGGGGESRRHTHSNVQRTLSLPALTLCDSELALPEHGALGLVEGQVVEGGGHVHHQLLAVLDGPQLCATPAETPSKPLVWSKNNRSPPVARVLQRRIIAAKRRFKQEVCNLIKEI